MRRHLAVLLTLPVLVAALGYFVDIYDLLLFTQVRLDSLRELGLSPEGIREEGTKLLNDQMIGLMMGGIFWGILGDKRGRLSVLFGSILLYSLANIANGFVHTLPQYALCRFIAGIGLAGELGAGITLVSELTPKENRGVATSFVAGIGLLGAVAAYFVKQHFAWRTCFFLGGGLGLLLLLLRVSVFESGLYKSLSHQNVRQGDVRLFFSNLTRARKYVLSILIGLPTWYVIGILVAFCNDYAKWFSSTEPVDPARGVMMAYVGISFGDIAIGILSQAVRSRKKAMFAFYALTVLCLVLFFHQDHHSASYMYALCAGLGFSTGFWAIFVTMAAEQFGTNLRATAATTVPNMVRGALPLLTWYMGVLSPRLGQVNAAICVGFTVMTIASLALFLSEETFGKDLDFLET